eukprot:g2226.t1
MTSWVHLTQRAQFAGAFLLVLLSSATATNICGENPILASAVLNAVNLSWPGLQKVAAAVRRGNSSDDNDEACSLLAEYYRTSNGSRWLRLPSTPAPSSRRAGGDADDLVESDVFHLSGVGEVAKVPRNADGGIDWTYQGPKSDPEFMNCLNRHDSFVRLLGAWNATGNPVYAKYFSALVEDWVVHLPCRAGVSRSGWRPGPGQWDKPCATGTMESPWRVLEAGIRPGGPWPPAFFGFQQSPDFTVSARALMVLGFSEHNAVLNGPGRSAGTPNWAIGQWAGLITSCAALPELKGCAALMTTAFEELEGWLDREVYPDGVETEESFGYGMWTAESFFNTIELVQRAGHAPPPASYTAKVERMFTYGAFANDQYGYSPRDGDMDLGQSGWYAPASKYFGRPDWEYVHTGGKSGAAPAGPSASAMFPWAGQAILRNTYKKEPGSVWLWVDTGTAYGSSGHAHASKNAVNLRAGGAMLLVDSGRFQYNGRGLSEQLNREYERTTTAHNTLTFDGCQQAYAPARATEPARNSSWRFAADSDFVAGVATQYQGLEGWVAHQRGTLVVKRSAAGLPLYIVVVDRVTTDRARTMQASWHAHPNAKVETGATGSSFNTAIHEIATIQGVSTATAVLTNTRLSIVAAAPAGEQGCSAAWKNVSIVRGQVGNATAGIPWQGWYSANYNGNASAPTLVYDARIPKEGATFAWLLVPENVTSGRGGVTEDHHRRHSDPLPPPSLTVEAAGPDGVTRVTVQVAGRTETQVLPLGPPPPPPSLYV